MRHLYLAATGQNRGKTTVSLGVLDGFRRRGLDAAFMKPVGQRTIEVDGVPADEDAILMQSVFGLPDPLERMSPVHIPRGFTRAYIEGRVVDDLPARIREAHASFAAGREILHDDRRAVPLERHEREPAGVARPRGGHHRVGGAGHRELVVAVAVRTESRGNGNLGLNDVHLYERPGRAIVITPFHYVDHTVGRPGNRVGAGVAR